MNLVLLGQLVLKYGPTVIAYAIKFGPDAVKIFHQIHTLISSGKTEITADELSQLLALGNKSPDDYLKEAGVTLPPGT